MNIAFTALHTGADYLAYAIRSVAPYVDRWIFAYSDRPSHGHGTDTPRPVDEDQLHDITHETLMAFNVPYTWYEGEWEKEGAQRDMVYRLSPSADVILVVDADEVWQGDAPAKAIAQAQAQDIHHWRSFDHICTDSAQPQRVRQPGASEAHEGYIDCLPVLHFGYARKPADIAYKMLIHGHLAEWRPEWYEETFMPWTPETGPHKDLHPTCHDNFWHVEPFDKTTLPAFMREHPYYDMEVIK